MAKTYDQAIINHVIKYYKTMMQTELFMLNRRIEEMIDGDVIIKNKKPMSPSAVLQKICKDYKDLKVLAQIEGFDFKAKMKEMVDKVAASRTDLNKIPLKTREDVCHAWFNIYEPNGRQPFTFYRKVTNEFNKLFKHIRASGYWPKTSQGAVDVWISPKRGEEFNYQEVVDEIKFILPYVKPQEDNAVHFHVITPDCSARGVVHIAVTRDLIAKFMFTRYSHETEKFKGSLIDTLMNIVKDYDDHCSDYDN